MEENYYYVENGNVSVVIVNFQEERKADNTQIILVNILHTIRAIIFGRQETKT